MTNPVLRGYGSIASATTNVALTVTIPAHARGDLIVLYTKSVSWFGGNVGGPQTPPGWSVLYSSTYPTGFEQILWTKVETDTFPGSITLYGSAGMTAGTWIAHADVISNADFRDPGWLEPVPGVASGATLTRADVTAQTSWTFMARVSFEQLGVAQWFYGWKNGDVGFGLNASNRPIFYINNTLGNPIGNVAANAAIPDFGPGRKVWIRVDIDTTTGNITYGYSYADVEEWWAAAYQISPLGTVVAGTNGGTTARVTNSDTIYIGTRDAAVLSTDLKVYAWAEVGFTNLYWYEQVYTKALQPGTALLGGGLQHIPSPELGTSSPIEDFRIGDGFSFLSGFFVPARQVFGEDRLVYNVWTGGSFEGQQANPVSGPSDMTAWPDRAASFGNWAIKNITRTKTVDAATVDDSATTSGHYSFSYFGLTIRGVASPILPPASPQPPNIRLGCAASYDLYLTDMTYDRVIDRVGWKSLSWDRVLDDISTASALVPDELGGVHCVARLGGLLPWAYGLRIERNDTLVWRGPIRKISRDGDAIRLNASDVLSRYQKRLMTRDAVHEHNNEDAAVVFKHIIAEHAATSYDPWAPAVPDVVVNVPISRALRPMEFKYAWDLLNELLDSAIDAFVMNGILYVWDPSAGWTYQMARKTVLDGPYNTSFDLVYGTFTAESFVAQPEWSIDGDMQGNFVVVPSADSGEYGFRTAAITEVLSSQIAFGVLDYVDPSPIELPADATPAAQNKILKARADTVAALRAYAPAIIEGGILSERAPIDVDNLIPGSLWKLDVYDAGYGQLTTVGRLRRVSVTVERSDAGLTEKVSPTLEPPGWSGELNG